MKTTYRFVLAVALALGAPAYAHHSFAAFDMAQTMTVTGTVKKFEWTNPHTWIVLMVENGQGQAEEWRFEGAPPVNMIRDGWNEDSLHAGDKVVLSYHPRKDGTHSGSFAGVSTLDGKPIVTRPAGGAPPGGG
ncbi:MAG: DUF6152 family protein [Steroidobacteraceae bacterium]